MITLLRVVDKTISTKQSLQNKIAKVCRHRAFLFIGNHNTRLWNGEPVQQYGLSHKNCF